MTEQDLTQHQQLGPHAGHFWQMVAAGRGLDHEQADILRTAYERRWDAAVERAGETTHVALRESGRMGPNFSGDPVWQAMDGLCGIAGGASDAAQAVLARDLISPRDFAVLTRPWRDVGLGIPGELVAPAPSRRGIAAMHPVRALLLSVVALFAIGVLAYLIGHTPGVARPEYAAIAVSTWLGGAALADLFGRWDAA